MTCKDLNYFLCWPHPRLAQLAADQTLEIDHLQRDLRVALDALRSYYTDGALQGISLKEAPINLAPTAEVNKP